MRLGPISRPLQLIAVSEDATALLAGVIAQHVQKGDTFCLFGEFTTSNDGDGCFEGVYEDR
jgi:hypothetical protein